MPILTLQRRMFEAGRIRIGQQTTTSNGKTHPKKLSTFRLTSSDRAKLDHAATIYGGTVEPWRNGQLEQYEIVTDVDALDVIVPPTDMAFSQYYELWSGGGCQRRCDGQRDLISDQPCACSPDPADRECKPTTRLSVMLARVQGAGLWRLESHGWFAATELAGSVELIQSAAGRGHLLPAVLRLDQRTVTRPGQPRRDFAVPVLDVKLPLAEIAQSTAGQLAGAPTDRHESGGVSVGELEARTSSTPVPFTPVPDTAPTREVGSVADQVTRHQQNVDSGPKRTSRSAAPVPATGRPPRTAVEVESEVRPVSAAQMTKLHAIFTEQGVKDRDERLQVSSQVVGRTLESSKDLTLSEATRLIDTLERGVPTQPELGGDQ